MSDLIDRQVAIDALEKVAVLFPWRVPGNRDSYDHYNEGWNDAIGRAEIEIEKLPSAQPERRWIPCSERLPEERQEILATTTDNAWGDVVIIRTYYKEMHKSVIAWMPLPEPYREGAQE